jgi:RecJ-like exonuclease
MTMRDCERCKGNGRIEMLEHCPVCRGTGQVPDDPPPDADDLRDPDEEPEPIEEE